MNKRKRAEKERIRKEMLNRRNRRISQVIDSITNNMLKKCNRLSYDGEINQFNIEFGKKYSFCITIVPISLERFGIENQLFNEQDSNKELTFTKFVEEYFKNIFVILSNE